MTTTTTSDGATVDFVIRWERGTIDRFIYTIAVLDPTETGPASLPYWNRKLIMYFGGGVAIGHYQGSNNQDESRYPYGLGKGYAIAWSTGTKTNTHYNLVLGGETALMVKSRFVTEYDDPDYTVGLGGSGGGIQQYVYGQNHPGLLDGAIPQYSYPDMVTQTIHVGDCELLERWLDFKVQERTCVAVARLVEPHLARRVRLVEHARKPVPAADAVARGARLDRVHQRLARPLAARAQPEVRHGARDHSRAAGAVEWTHWNDAVNVYGRDPVTGFARSTWDNVGVQYGLQALRDGHLTPAEFLDLNATVGGWKPPEDTVQEGCPFTSHRPARRTSTSGAPGTSTPSDRTASRRAPRGASRR